MHTKYISCFLESCCMRPLSVFLVLVHVPSDRQFWALFRFSGVLPVAHVWATPTDMNTRETRFLPEILAACASLGGVFWLRCIVGHDGLGGSAFRGQYIQDSTNTRW